MTVEIFRVQDRGRRTCLDLAEHGEGLDGFVVVGDEIHHPVAALPQLLRVHRPQPLAAAAAGGGGSPIAAPAPIPWHAKTEPIKKWRNRIEQGERVRFYMCCRGFCGEMAGTDGREIDGLVCGAGFVCRIAPPRER